jgi:hypothetical protein
MGSPVLAQLKINEVYYDVSPQGGNQYVELYNAGTNTVHLDGLILSDEVDGTTESVFQFPGGVGGTNFPVAPSGRVTIAVDAIDATSNATWECYGGAADTNNPSVPDLAKIGGTAPDLSLFSGGDNVYLADGTDTNLPIDQATVIDGVNFAGGGGELAWLSSSAAVDGDASVTAGTGLSLSRCGDGADSDSSSSADFFARTITPLTANNCTVPSFVINDVSVTEGNAGTTSAVFTIALTATSATPVSVSYATANGTATAGVDYVSISATTLVFLAGVTAQTVSVTVNGEALVETNETFFVNLSTPTNAVIADSQGVGTILDDDGAGALVFTSRFVRIAGPGHAVTTVWTAVSGGQFQVQFTTNLLAPAWSNLGSQVLAVDTNSSLVDTSSATASPRLYRVLYLY